MIGRVENLETMHHDFPRDQRESVQPVVHWIALFLKTDAKFNVPSLQVLSKVIESTLAWVFTGLLTPSDTAC